ncbi:hypothetical protein Nepgr_011644 [Nepenthes gracilis]|uniref:Uncharacterized protein n=1 Tax=Nepenthes gracilis TaxID=150966 RepID=A0AAD3SEQ6_NEPGR|nr:hypothetical protein Nepgr_011644 [Nepenthes gracilis]
MLLLRSLQLKTEFSCKANSSCCRNNFRSCCRNKNSIMDPRKASKQNATMKSAVDTSFNLAELLFQNFHQILKKYQWNIMVLKNLLKLQELSKIVTSFDSKDTENSTIPEFSTH